MKTASTKKATFGAGCFWGVEASFRNVTGVRETAAGFMGGTTKDPSYAEVCTGTTGHAEVVEVKYDSRQVSYEALVEVFWRIHDPTSLNRQGWDVGTQYRSVIFYHDAQQKAVALASKDRLQKALKKSVMTEIVPASAFYRAEEYHQRYLEKKGKAVC